MLFECSYCSTSVKSTSEDTTIMDCPFCGKVLSLEEEWFTQRTQRKIWDIMNRDGRQRQKVECEQSCVTTADCIEDETDLSDSGSTALSKVTNSNNDALSEAAADCDTILTKSAKE